MKLRIGTRGSALALWQTRHVAQGLRARWPDLVIEEVVIQTEGDRNAAAPIASQDERGVFVRRIEEALAEGRVDLAVHSLKDLPTTQPAGLVIAAVPQRHDARDTLLTREGYTFETLPGGSRLATGSPRRRSQLLYARKDVDTVPVRGNVDTRVRKLVEGAFDGLVLALAGIERLGIREVPSRPLPISLCLPAVGQGALAIETRRDDARAREFVAVLGHGPTERAVAAERAFLHALGGGCLAPATAYARAAAGTIEIDAVVGDPDGKTLLRDRIHGPEDRGDLLGEELAARLIAAGAAELLRQARS